MSVTRQGNPHPIVINWHVTESCNYRCHYCYAKWQRPDRTDLIRNSGATKALLEALYSHFGFSVAGAPRLNFAGGEPLLYAKRLLAAMALARSIGFEVSLISNGSRLSERLMAELAPQLTLLGLSIDSAMPNVLSAIGRHDIRGVRLNLGMLARYVSQARRINPRLKLKINTVVCSAKWQEDLSNVIRELTPQRWKVLRMLPVLSRELEASDQQFRDFVERHRSLGNVLAVEDNDDMVGSYIMVDPYGRFFQNREASSGYDYSPPILEVGPAQAFSKIRWSRPKFVRRYARFSHGRPEF
jgi:radical S-adenosyl methionine domain-containing protein 2